MDRVEKRKLDRSNMKNQKWFDNLPYDKIVFIGSLIEQQTSTNDRLISAIMDMCFSAAMDDNLNIDIGTIKKIIKEGNEYILDYKLYLDKEGYEEGFDMIENLELKEKVKTKIKKYMGEKKDKATGIKLIKKEFNLPNAEISDLWTICRAELTNDKRAVKQLEDIHNKGKEEYMQEVAIENENILKNKDVGSGVEAGGKNLENVREKEIDECKAFANGVVMDKAVIGGDSTGLYIKTTPGNVLAVNGDDDVESLITKVEEVHERRSKLKVVNTITEIQGEYGVYLKTSKGVELVNRVYRNVAEVEEEELKVRSNYEQEMLQIETKIRILNENLEKTREEGKKKLEGLTELKEVFYL